MNLLCRQWVPIASAPGRRGVGVYPDDGRGNLLIAEGDMPRRLADGLYPACRPSTSDRAVAVCHPRRRCPGGSWAISSSGPQSLGVRPSTTEQAEGMVSDPRSLGGREGRKG
jgi:hypothetical protein